LHWPYNRLHHLGFVGVGRKRRDGDALVSGWMPLAKLAENDQYGGKQRAEDNELSGLGLEKIEEVAWFHGCLDE
jgi:hypothetical protein